MTQTSESLLTLLENLIRFPTTSDNINALEDCANFICDYFRNTPLHVEVLSSEGVPSVVVTKQTKKPKVFLCGHFDVVKGSSDQFVPRRDGTRLYGRGALDMKSGVAVLMMLMKDLAHTDHDVGLMLTGDEEVGGWNGTQYVLNSGYSCEVAILPDGGFDIHRVTTRQKGACFFTLRAEGKSAHGSRPWEGDNAIEKLIGAIQRVQTLFPLSINTSDRWINTLTISQIQGGVSMNAVPETATVSCDVRFIEGFTPEKIINLVRDVLPKGIILEEKICGPMVELDTDNTYVVKFFEAIKKHGRDPVFDSAYGSSDARFFPPEIPVIISQPYGTGHHSADEWVDMESIGEYYKLLRTYLDGV